MTGEELPFRLGSSLPSVLACAAVGWAALAVAAPAAGQVRPDTAQVAPDSAQVVPDPGQLPDSLAAPGQQALADSLQVDTIFYNLPSLEHGVPAGFATGVWTWDHEAIMASGANTVAELVAEVPGVLTLLGGDYGTPLAISAFGTGGGGVRIFRDGFEVFPLDGGLADLQRIGLVGVTEVRLDRAGGELVVELTTYRYDDGRPFSLVEAGTGQLDTNVFRGTFADPTALGGSVALGLERVDTRGYGQDEGGNRTGTWFRYQLHRGDRAGLAVDYRSMGSETQVIDYASSVKRTDLLLRARVEVVRGVSLEAYTGKSTHEVDDAREAYEFEGGTRSQHGVRVAAEARGLWARGAFRLYPDDDLPADRLDAAGGYSAGRLGAYGRVSRATWGGTSVLGYGGGGWLGPLAGVTLFGSVEAGAYAGRSGPPLDERPEPTPPEAWPAPPEGPGFGKTDRTALRLGASASLLGVTLAGAGLRVESDAQLPLGTELDRGAPQASGADRNGVEGWASLPTPWRSLRLEGSYQYWDRPGPYLPRQIYKAGLVFHRTYLESGNFELWWSLGVRGHDPMLVFVADDGQGGAG
ncbi:MAG TPA: Plug domain-containing protein, partial [Longimicrobiales bacterium]|nr:Plug domain-containing protein [Longimicrobiales bacterium]